MSQRTAEKDKRDAADTDALFASRIPTQDATTKQRKAVEQQPTLQDVQTAIEISRAVDRYGLDAFQMAGGEDLRRKWVTYMRANPEFQEAMWRRATSPR